MDTTIKVDARVRDRLAEIAAERGRTIRDLVAELAAATPTRREIAELEAAKIAYVRDRLDPDFGDADVADGENLWRRLREAAASRHDAALDGPHTSDGQPPGGVGAR